MSFTRYARRKFRRKLFCLARRPAGFFTTQTPAPRPPRWPQRKGGARQLMRQKSETRPHGQRISRVPHLTIFGVFFQLLVPHEAVSYTKQSISPESPGISRFSLGPWLSIPLLCSPIGAHMAQVGACVVQVGYTFRKVPKVITLDKKPTRLYLDSRLPLSRFRVYFGGQIALPAEIVTEGDIPLGLMQTSLRFRLSRMPHGRHIKEE
jgi:hypothetical protein